MTDEKVTNPFKIGDRLVFSPSKHTTGWEWSSFDRVRLKPGDAGVVTRIENEDYLYLDDGRGGFHWECFKRADLPTARE
jgi:hypothetical protein